MNALRGLALNAFLARRHARARRLFEEARSRAGTSSGDAATWPDHAQRTLTGIVEEALLGDREPGSPGLVLAADRVGALLQQLPTSAAPRDQVTRRLVERVGFELARLAQRSDLMQRFGPPMTVAEAAWAIQADPDFLAEGPGEASYALDGQGEAPNALDGQREAAFDGAASLVTPDHLVAAAQRHGPAMRFSYQPYVFAGLDQPAQVRFSSPRLFQAFDARMAHTGRQTTERTSFTLRPTALAADVVERVVTEIGFQRPSVRFEFASHDDGAVQVATFREAMVGRVVDGIELILDYGKKAFRTDQMPEDVWRALASSSPVTVAIVL